MLSSKQLAVEVQALVLALKRAVQGEDDQREDADADADTDEESVVDDGEESAAEDDVDEVDKVDETMDVLSSTAHSPSTTRGMIVADGEEDGIGDDDGWESGSVDEPGPTLKRKRTDDANDDDSEGDAETDDDEASQDARPTRKSSKTATGSSSVFLPSLSVGFVRGSDSDWSDGEAQAADGIRKNRRGQRARQA